MSETKLTAPTEEELQALGEWATPSKSPAYLDEQRRLVQRLLLSYKRAVEVAKATIHFRDVCDLERGSIVISDGWAERTCCCRQTSTDREVEHELDCSSGALRMALEAFEKGE